MMVAGLSSLFFGVDSLDSELQEKMGSSSINLCQGKVSEYDSKVR